MKKLLTAILMSLFLISCATTRPKVEHKYANITPDKIQNTCEAEGRWWMHIANVAVVVLQFDNCLGVDDMLVMVTPADKHTPDIRSYSYKLLGLHYLEFLNKTKADKAWSIQQIKEFIVNEDGEDGPSWMVIYKVNSKPLKCTKGSCK
jgi:hypothetical protein